MRACLMLVLALALSASAVATAAPREAFGGDFRVTAGLGEAGAYPGGLENPEGALRVPEGAIEARLTLGWAAEADERPRLLFRVCEGRCAGEGSVLREVAGAAPLSVAVPIPASRNLTWEALVASGAVVDSGVEGEAVYQVSHAQTQAPGPVPATTRAGLALSLAAAIALAAWRLRPLALAVSLYHRLRRDNLLDHPVRARIHEAVAHRPGVHFRALRAQLGVGQGTLDHHLALLLRAGLVTERREKGARCFALPGALDARVLALAARLRSSASRALLAAIARAEGSSLRESAARAGLPESTAANHVARFVADGLVEKRREGGRVHLALTRDGRRVVDALLE